MALVLAKHATCTHVLVAHFAEELNLFVLMFETKDFAVYIHSSLMGANRDGLEHAPVRSDPNCTACFGSRLFISLMGLTILLLLCRLVAMLSVDGLDLFVINSPCSTIVLSRL